jgi:beta-glucosidase
VRATADAAGYDGYSIRFGLIFLDYATQKRTPELSAAYYADLIRSHAPA